MTIEEIYSQIANHMIKGMMIHEQLANYYDFLGLGGYKRCHEYHYLKETCSYRSVCRYFINHHNKLIPETPIDNPEMIPASWYNYSRQDVDASTKRNAVKNGLTEWVKWETETKDFYEHMYAEAMKLEEVASACKIKELIMDTDRELKKAQRYHINKMAADYDMTYIIEEQDEMHDKYKCKMKKIGIKLC